MQKLKKRLTEVSRMKKNRKDFIILNLEESVLYNTVGAAVTNSKCSNVRCGYKKDGDTNNTCTNHNCYDGDTNSSCTNNSC